MTRRKSADPACVPRRFGVGTLLIVTSCYACLIGGLKAAGSHWILIACVCGLLSLVGLVQFLNKPRLARRVSIAVGLLIGLLPIGAAWWDHPDWYRWPYDRGIMVQIGAASLFGGALLGYLAGTLVAGVFLLMNLADQWIQQRRVEPPNPEEDIAADG